MDETLARLRRAAEQDPSLRPQLLVARVRAGELTQERLELAAYVGDPVAREALGPEVRRWTSGRVCCCGSDEQGSEHTSLEDYTHGFVHACEYYGSPCECTVEEHVSSRPRTWRGDRVFDSFLTGLARYADARGAQNVTLVRAWLAVAELVWEWNRHLQRRWDIRVRRAIGCAKAWVAAPTEAARAAWAEQAYGPWGPPEWLMRPMTADGYPGDDAASCILAAVRERLVPEPEARVVITRALAAWALGDA